MFTTNSTFRSDLEFLLEKLKNRDKFVFCKYADGEYMILVNKLIRNCDGWVFNPELDNKEHQLLLDSFRYNHPDYYVGISCPCCQPESHINWMRDNVGSKNITWANIFVNSNYDFFVNNFIPEFNRWEGKVILFANEEGIDKKLPFKIDKYVPLNLTSWKEPEVSKIIEDSKIYSDEEENQLFLFSAGPLGNMLSHQLHSHNKNNTYIDIGSTINPWIVGNNRGYLKRNNKTTCIW